MIFKKIDIVQDDMSAGAGFFMSNLINYNQKLEYNEYAKMLGEVKPAEVKALFESLASKIEIAKSYVVSKDAEIESIKGLRVV